MMGGPRADDENLVVHLQTYTGPAFTHILWKLFSFLSLTHIGLPGPETPVLRLVPGP